MASPTELLTNKFLEIVNQLQTTVTAHGQEAVNLALTSIQVDAAGYFLMALGSFLIAFLVYKLKKFVFTEDWDDDEFTYGRVILYVIVLCPPAAGLFVWGLLEIFDIWNYAALINPKLYLAHTIVTHVLNGVN